MKVRTRFAPSPTGYLHVGGIRTALFAWLVARQAAGQFLLRIEDTDKAREVAGADKHIIESLNALGLNFDGEPYYQSQHLDVYKEWAQKLYDDGQAYADPYSAKEVQAFREEAQKAKQPFLYRNHRPDNPPAWDGSQPLRFKAPVDSNEKFSGITDYWHDEVMGDIGYTPQALDDIVLIKSDGYPTYNFAHIIDDNEMQITHVIRGQEFLPSVANYMKLYEVLGFDVPKMATMPHILNEQGNKKLSKRDGAKDVLDYIREGYLPDALVNFIASLGWNDGTEQEIYSRQELIEKFSLKQVQRSGARFDEKRLVWMNGQHIAKLSDEELSRLIEEGGFWPAETSNASDGYKQKIIGLIKQRIHTLADVPHMSSMFFNEPEDEAVTTLMEATKIDAGTRRQMLEAAKRELSKSSFSEGDIRDRLNGLLEKLDTKPAILFALIRIAISGEPYSPELFGSLAVVGKEKALGRLDKAIGLL